jgi:hypothetical protein
MVALTFCHNLIIFTLFLAPEPRRQRDDVVDMFVDLGATQEDHEMVHSLLSFFLVWHTG